MKIEKAKLDELKSASPGGIFEGTITFTDEADTQHSIEFVYRKPTTTDLEAHSKVAQKNQIIANLNLIQSIIVHPEPSSIISEIRDYPAAYGKFVEEALVPFFGSSVVVKSRRL